MKGDMNWWAHFQDNHSWLFLVVSKVDELVAQIPSIWKIVAATAGVVAAFYNLNTKVDVLLSEHKACQEAHQAFSEAVVRSIRNEERISELRKRTE